MNIYLGTVLKIISFCPRELRGAKTDVNRLDERTYSSPPPRPWDRGSIPDRDKRFVYFSAAFGPAVGLNRPLVRRGRVEAGV
jgi:hypothetical protein